METLASATPPPGAFGRAELASAFEHAIDAARAAHGPAAALDAAVGSLHERLGGAGIAVFVLEHGRLWSVSVRGYAMVPDGLPLEEGIIGRAVRTLSVQFAPDVRSDPDFIEVSRAAVSEVAVPLTSSVGVVGVLNVETPFRLPDGTAEAAAALGQVISGPLDELRASRTVDLSSLARLFVYMSSLREPAAIADVAVRSLGRVLPIETSQLLLVDDEGRLAEATHWSASGPGQELLPPAVLESLRHRIEASAVFELLDASTQDVPELKGLRLRSLVLIPLRANGSDIGLLTGSSRFAREFDRNQAELAALLAAHAAASLDAAIALDRERRSAHTDPLTGLLNRRGLEERLDRELGDAQDDRRPISLVVLDCDDFKDVNDRAGHEFGDALLREVGLVLRAASPQDAAPARLGGDEFVVLLPGLDGEEALVTVDRLRQELGRGLDEAGFPLRLSAGVSTYPQDGAGTTQLLRAADQALYSAKARGKDRVVAFREIVRGAGAVEAAPTGRLNRARGVATDVSALASVMDAATAICREDTAEAVLERLSRSLSFTIGATATAISRVDGDRLTDTATHSLRDVSIDEDESYLIADYPVTREVLESGCVRSVCFLDEDLDSAEAFVLRELEMNAAMLLPLVVHGAPWGLVELYDMRMRRFTPEQEAVASFLVAEAARRLEVLGDLPHPKRRLRRLRTPS